MGQAEGGPPGQRGPRLRRLPRCGRARLSSASGPQRRARAAAGGRADVAGELRQRRGPLSHGVRGARTPGAGPRPSAARGPPRASAVGASGSPPSAPRAHPRGARTGRRDVAHVDPPAHDVPPLASARSAAGTSSPTGAKISARVQLLGAAASEASPAHSAPSSRANACAASSPGAGEGEDPPALVARHLADDVGGRAEAVEPEPLGVARQPQRAVADQARAQERRGLQVRKPSGIGKQKRSSATAARRSRRRRS